jgi:GH15 family glucan-1,4-alpha-glucosidase
MDGTADWFCCARFDSPIIFASLLDADEGGYMRVAPATDNYVTRQLYFPDTAMLITRFLTEDGSARSPTSCLSPGRGSPGDGPAPASPPAQGGKRRHGIRRCHQSAL